MKYVHTHIVMNITQHCGMNTPLFATPTSPYMDICNNIANSLNNGHSSIGTLGQEEEERLTAKLQKSSLKLHSFPVTAAAQKRCSRDTKETEGEAITLLLGLINNKLMKQCKENIEGAQFGILSRHVELPNSAQGTCKLC